MKARRIRAQWGHSRLDLLRRRLSFWKPWLAGKVGMACLRVGARDLAQKLIDYERDETLRIANSFITYGSKAEADLVESLAEQIREEEDERILRDLKDQADRGEWN